jgi:hypothetical protein
VSLILDALKKLEREKGEAGHKGILVLGAVPWGDRQARRTPLVVGATVGVLGVFACGALATWWILRPARPAVPAAAGAVPAAGAPAAAPAAPSGAEVVPPRPAPTNEVDRPAAEAAARYLPPAANSRTSPAPAPAAPSSAAPRPADAEVPHVAVEPAPAPPPTAAPSPPEIRLTAISQRDGQPVALINDRLVRAGDSFDGIRVVRIGETEVEVEVRGQRRVIRF